MMKTQQAPARRHGERLADLRKAAGLTQVALAAQLDLTQQNIARWEAADRPPPSRMLPRLAEVLGVSVEQLVNAEAKHGKQKRGPPSRGHKLVDEVEQLPPRYREKIYDVVGALLEQYRRAA